MQMICDECQKYRFLAPYMIFGTLYTVFSQNHIVLNSVKTTVYS